MSPGTFFPEDLRKERAASAVLTSEQPQAVAALVRSTFLNKVLQSNRISAQAIIMPAEK
jgi:hypothetical protein